MLSGRACLDATERRLLPREDLPCLLVPHRERVEPEEIAASVGDARRQVLVELEGDASHVGIMRYVGGWQRGELERDRELFLREIEVSGHLDETDVRRTDLGDGLAEGLD